MPQVSATSATPPPAAAASDTPIPPDTHLRDGGHSDTTLARARLAIGGALLNAYLFTRPWGTEGTLEGAAAWADPRWPLSHLAAMVGFTGLVAAAHGLSRDWSHHARRLVDSTAWASLALLLPYYGAEAFALHAIGRAATQTGDLDLVALAEPIRMGALQVTTFGLGWLALGILAATVGRGLTRRDPRPALRATAWGWALALCAYLPVFYAPPAIRIGHALLVGTLSITVAALLHDPTRRD